VDGDAGRCQKGVMAADQVVVLFGAYGHTGRFVVSELRRRGMTPILSGRDTEKLAALARLHAGAEVRPATIEDRTSLDHALAGAGAVINCAGPFGETAPAVIEAALRSGIHYLDVTGEALVTIDTFARYAERQPDAGRVREASVTIVPSVAFFGALGDLLATTALGDWPSVEEISIAVALDSWKPTRGTRLAGERRAGRRVVFRNRRIETLPGKEPPPTGTWDFPPPFGKQEVIGELPTVDIVTISRHLRPQKINAYINVTPINDLHDPDSPGPEATDDRGRSSQIFLVDVVVRRGSEKRRATARGRDIYAITAPIVAQATERILDGRCKRAGIGSTSEIFEAEDFLRALAPELSFEVTETTGAAGETFHHA
jgi:NAD(P)-dependent dehydrogenase (short-subunit alcohol dehydrogenase family)